MKKAYAVVFVIGLAACLAAAVAAQTGPTALKDGDYSQPAPYTATFFGPWNAGVAKTHVPEVTFEKMGTAVMVKVKVDSHPMDPEKPHWIMWIRVEDETGKELGKHEFKATDAAPVATFHVMDPPAKIKVFERCNIHGIWLNETAVTVK
ncbi:MAG TPA: desulfoferrodoxin family protein [Acidobacteriota bacterium]|nr:desulfoferrodoxin family protein [Acidobacteriota bacterium]